MSGIFEVGFKMKKFIDEWEKWAEKIAIAAKEILGECEVYVFGSVVEGKATGGSDVDILIICDKVPKKGKDRADIIVKIEELANLPLFHPFEIHIVDKKEANWYWKHIKKAVRIR